MLTSLIKDINNLIPLKFSGQVTAVKGLRLEAQAPSQAMVLGADVRIGDENGPKAEIVGFRDDRAILLAYDPIDGIHPGMRIDIDPSPAIVKPDMHWLGRTLDAFAQPIDDQNSLASGTRPINLRASPPPAHTRMRITQRLDLGISAMDMFSPCGYGQRLGLFAGSGVGKSTLMAMLARNAKADVIVIGLIGERGREVREFIEDALGTEGLKRSVIVCATSDEPAPKRRRAGWLTLSIAEYFRDQGLNVLCLFDSVTRFALAQREIGLAAGEPTTTRGYTPSVFSELPKLLERAGPGAVGSGTITGLFTVLVEGDDHNEPIADAVRGILDGHVTMDRAIAERGQYPAIDVMRSISRLSHHLQNENEQAMLREARQLAALYNNMEELVRIGAYTKGTDAQTDRAIAFMESFNVLLGQSHLENRDPDENFHKLSNILQSLN